jgi:hypothetical protein
MKIAAKTTPTAIPAIVFFENTVCAGAGGTPIGKE